MKACIVLFALVAAAFAQTTTVYDLTTEKAPASQFVYEGWFSSNSYQYCRGVLYNNDAQLCCNGKLIDQTFKTITVDGVSKTTGEKVCCGTATTTENRSFNTTAFDGGNIIELGECCGDSYETSDSAKTCCGGSYVKVEDNKACCEGTYASNYFQGVTQICCGGAWTNDTAQTDETQCCIGELTVLNGGYVANPDGGYWSQGDAGYTYSYPTKVTKGTVYNSKTAWCCNGAVTTKLSDGTAFFNDTETQEFVCCDGEAKQINPKFEIACGNYFLKSGCTTKLKTELSVCKSSDWCDAKYSNSYQHGICGAKIGKGVNYNPRTETAWNSAGNVAIGGEKSGAATAVFSLAALVAAFAFLF